MVGPLPSAGGPFTPHSRVPTQSHARLCTHVHSEEPSLAHTHAHSRCHQHSHPHPLFSPGEPGGRDLGKPRVAADARGPGRAQPLRGSRAGQPRAHCAGDSAAPPCSGRSAEPPPGRTALAPALCYANSLSQLVPAACTMSAPSPRQPSPAREWGRGAGVGVAGGSAPRVQHPSLAQPGRVVGRPISSLPPVLPSPMLAGPRPSGSAGHPLIHSIRPGCPPSRCQGLMKSKRLLGGWRAVRMKEKQPPPRPHS